MKHLYLRHFKSGLVVISMIIATIIVLLPLCFIFVNIVKMGLSSLSPEFFTSIPKPPDESGGGVANGLVGSGIMILISSLIGLPIGVLGAVYLSEHRHATFASVIRFCADVLAGVPSIITGMVAYVLVVVPFKSFSAIAGSVALALIMIPIVLRTAEEQLKMVPDTLREASLALGVPHWRTSLKVIVRSAMSGVITGVLLAVARIAGETAPLLFTALGNQFWNWKLMQPMAALPLQIFNFAISPYDGWHKLAWGGALVLVVIMFSINLAAKSFGKR